MRTSRRSHWITIALIALTSICWAQSAMADDERWACEVVLCLANPQGPTALSECRPPIERAWKAWAKGRRVPDCKRKNRDGSTGDSIRSSGTFIDSHPSNPHVEGGCPFVYYAGRDKTKHCAFTGVTNEYIDGALWGRIWYGGPGGVPYIEKLHEDPANPRPADGFEEAWRVLKGDIESKADYSALAYKIWEDSEKRAVVAERKAEEARKKADAAAAELAWYEDRAPAAWAAAIERQEASHKAYIEAERAAAEAKVRGDSPTATPEEKAKYLAALAAVSGARDALYAAMSDARWAKEMLDSLPARRRGAEHFEAEARGAEATAYELRTTADINRKEADAAELAARPLPAYGD